MRLTIFLLLVLLTSKIFAQKKDSVESPVNTIEYGIRYEDFIDRETYRIFNSFLYGYKIENKHELFGRLIHQNRNNDNAIQGIIDYYPTYSDGYMFFSLRYSNSILFPRFIGMGEVYYNYANKLESSIGLRYMIPLENSEIYIVTGTFGIYHGNWYTYGRPMMNFLSDGTKSWSGQLTTRRYFGEGKTYIEASVLRGQDAGTTRPIGSIENSFGLDTYLMRLKGNIKLPNNYFLSVGGDYSGIFIPRANGSKIKLNIAAVDINIKKKF